MTRNRTASRQLEIISELQYQSQQLDLLNFVSEDLGLTPVVTREKESRSRSHCVKVSTSQFDGYVDFNKTFATLCLGDSNHFAIEATKRFLVQEKSDYGMIYLKAESGLGKTHILHAVANELMSAKKSFTIGTPLMMSSLLDNLNYLKAYEFLLIDDVEEICDHPELQKKFCQLFDFAQMGKMKIIIAGGVAPKDLRNCEARFKGKLSAGLMQVIKGMAPNLARDIVESKCKSIQLNLPVGVSDLITRNIEFNAYGLESVLHRLKNISERSNAVLSMEMVSAELPVAKSPVIKKTILITENFQELIDRVAVMYNLKTTDILERSRKNEFVFARHVAMFVIRERLGLSFPKIAEVFNRDHSTVMYGIERIKMKIKVDSAFEKSLLSL